MKRHDERGEREGGLDKAEHCESSHHQTSVEQMAPDGRAVQRSFIGWFCAECQGGEDVGADVECEHLEHTDRQREPARRQRPHDEGRQFGDVVGKVVVEKPANVGERRTALRHSGDDGLEVIIQQDDICRLTRHVGAALAPWLRRWPLL